MNPKPIDPSTMADSPLTGGGPPTSNAEGSSLYTCSRCNRLLPSKNFYKSKHSRRGFQASCKDCDKEKGRKNYRANRKKYLEQHRAWKAANRARILITNRAWRRANPERQRNYTKKWVQNNLERALKLRRARTTANQLRIKEQNRLWRATNRERRRETDRAWCARNPTMRAYYMSLRRARTLSAPGADYTTPQHIKWRWEMWGNRCYICGAQADSTDHVIAAVRGGSYWPANLRPICTPCNSSKHKHPLQDFLRFTNKTLWEMPKPNLP